jgi:hypothetical protein
MAVLQATYIFENSLVNIVYILLYFAVVSQWASEEKVPFIGVNHAVPP